VVADDEEVSSRTASISEVRAWLRAQHAAGKPRAYTLRSFVSAMDTVWSDSDRPGGALHSTDDGEGIEDPDVQAESSEQPGTDDSPILSERSGTTDDRGEGVARSERRGTPTDVGSPSEPDSAPIEAGGTDELQAGSERVESSDTEGEDEPAIFADAVSPYFRVRGDPVD